VFKRIYGILLACGCLAACSGGTNHSAVLPEAPPPDQTPMEPITPLSITPAIKHITVVIMENYAYSRIIGSSAAPYENALARANALWTNSHAVAHPSEPNYLALFSGSTHGVTSDYCPLTYSTQNLATELLSHGFTFAGYAENWPSSAACYGTYSLSVHSRYMYWRKHVPWTDFSNLAYRTYGHTYYGPGTPLTGSVNFVVPNICHDMHDCSVASGDAWLAKNLPPIISYNSTHGGLLIVTFDEADNDSTNHIATIMIGPMVHHLWHTGYITHYSVLRLIEANFHLPYLGYSYYAPAISL
jgi:acid phosphatase